jgi:hypothetical protein
MKTMTFIRCAGVWALFTCGPGFFALIHFSRWNPYNVWTFLSLVLVAVMKAGLSWSLVLEASTPKKAIFSGGALGLGLPILGAYLVQEATADFDNWSLIPGALLVSLPSAMGGALAAWIQWRSNEFGSSALAQRSVGPLSYR